MLIHIPNKEERNPANNRESGFTMIEMVVAIAIITVGLLGTAAAIAQALKFTLASRNATDTKLKVVTMLEQIENLRNTRRLTFGQIANSGQVDNTGAGFNFEGFSTGWRSISRNPGPDGIYGTSDDFANQSMTYSGHSQQVTITSLSTYFKKVEVRIRYDSGTGQITEMVGCSYLNDDSHGIYRR